MSTFYCSELARTENEQIFGTVKPIRIYLALEYWQPWHRKAVESEFIPVEVRQFVARIREQVPQSRFLLVRQAASKDRKPSCFLAIPNGAESIVYRRPLQHYRDILSISIADLLAGRRGDTGVNTVTGLECSTEPMFLVCNHGKHDKCCAKFGTPVLAQNTSETVWESSHVGGCRFAANMLCLPHGLVFGRLTPCDASRVTQEYGAGRLDLANFRGRANYAKPVQAAEYFVRKAYSIPGIDELRLRSSIAKPEASWTTTFETGTNTYEVDHTVTQSAEPRILACADTEPEFVWSNQLQSIRELPPGSINAA